MGAGTAAGGLLHQRRGQQGQHDRGAHQIEGVAECQQRGLGAHRLANGHDRLVPGRRRIADPGDAFSLSFEGANGQKAFTSLRYI